MLSAAIRFSVAVTIISLAFRPTSGEVTDQVIEAATQSRKTLAKLYETIRNIALPPTSDEATGDEPTEQRLVMILPGKVLSYYDYFPGDEYEANLENPDLGYTDHQVTIPPRVMENMFSLADVIPGRYPLRGAETGESMSVIYEDILNKMEVKGFTQKTQAEKERYVRAISYLAEEIPDPLNVTMNVTRFGLYRRSQELYNQKRLEMENIIDEQRNKLFGIPFERWFQRNYPTLKSQVEGAYTEWLIFGQKEIVELYKSYLDVESPGVDLEKARMTLRASGVSSLDRARTIYPVSFVPGNWYRYLTNVTLVDEAQQRRQEEARESRDEILVQIGELQAQKRVLIALQAAEPSEQLVNELNKLKQSLDTANQNLTNFADSTESLRQKCLISRIQAKAANGNITTDVCAKYAQAIGSSGGTVDSNTELFACVSDLDSQVNAFEKTQEALNATVTQINEQIEALQQRLSLAGAKFSQLARGAQHAADTQDQLDSNWLNFHFDSSSSASSYSATSQHYSAAFNGKTGGLFWGVRSSFSYSKSERSFIAAMNSAKTVVEGQLLRVTVQRPWFRPSLFKSKQFQIRLDETAKVSPGHVKGEKQFIHKITTEENYLLPEYVTGLLLSRNVNIELRGITVSQAGRAVRTATRSSLSGGGNFGFWRTRVSGGFRHSRSSRTYSMESSSDGLRISFPGAQVIGYYTQVMPKFPNSD